MFTSILLIICSLNFLALAWYYFDLALAFLFLFLPVYLIRFNLGPLPTTLLEIMIGIITIVWVINKLKTKNDPSTKSPISNLKFQISKNKLLFVGIFFFLIASTISVFTSLNLRAALGEWKAFYIEPVILFFVLISFSQKQKTKNETDFQLSAFSSLLENILFTLILCGLAVSLLSIYQHFTGWMVPSAFWENGGSYRVTAWYGFPNGVGLFLAPLYPLAIYLLHSTYKKIKGSTKPQFTIYCLLFTEILFLISAPFAILFAKSTGGLIGMLAGVGLLLIFYKKTRWPILITGAVSFILIMTLPALEPIKTEVMARDRSGQIRRAIWSETFEMLKDSPITGAGLASYTDRIAPYHREVNGEGIEIFHHPHNILLTMWVNLGILGLLGFILILIWFYKTGVQSIIKYNFEFRNSKFEIYLLSSMTAILVTGLVDSPYIKNDLSIFFWLLVAMMTILNNYEKLEKPKTTQTV